MLVQRGASMVAVQVVASAGIAPRLPRMILAFIASDGCRSHGSLSGRVYA